MTFALLIANRGFFPSSVIDAARAEMRAAFEKAGVGCLTSPTDLTKYGAVETTSDGAKFAAFLNEHRGEFDGVVICLPNFGDENGIKVAVADAGVPILLQAYPDRIGEMDFEHRRDAFCGKLGLTSVFKQMGVKYTTDLPFVVHPSDPAFDRTLRKFIATCRVVKGMRRMRLGAYGARTTAFKSVRYDEIALERHGIDVETLDLSSLFARMEKTPIESPEAQDWLERLHAAGNFVNAPEGRDKILARLGATFEATAREMALDAVAVRCWSEMQQLYGIAPCSVLGVLNQSGIPTVCELDITNAVTMTALALASGQPSGCLDWNNNYDLDLGKAILFHCGPLPLDLMEGPGMIEDHKMLSKSFGENRSWGLNVGRIKKGTLTLASLRTDLGELQFYCDKGEIVDMPVEESFFGTYGVLELPDLQKKIGAISDAGFRHHVTVTRGDWVEAVSEAFTKYLGYQRVNL